MAAADGVAALDGLARRALTGTSHDPMHLPGMFAALLDGALERSLEWAIATECADMRAGGRDGVFVSTVSRREEAADSRRKRAEAALADCRRFSVAVDRHALGRVVERVVDVDDLTEGGIGAAAAKEARRMALRLNRPAWHALGDGVSVAPSVGGDSAHGPAEQADHPGAAVESRKRARDESEAGAGGEDVGEPAGAAGEAGGQHSADAPAAKRAAVSAAAPSLLGAALGGFHGDFSHDDDDEI